LYDAHQASTKTNKPFVYFVPHLLFQRPKGTDSDFQFPNKQPGPPGSKGDKGDTGPAGSIVPTNSRPSQENITAEKGKLVRVSNPVIDPLTYL